MSYKIFISYSAKDSNVARELHRCLASVGTDLFLAEIDLKPGSIWKESILRALEESPWVFFLATPHSCGSQAVAHEIGASLVLRKKFIPLLWNTSTKDLPPWVDDRQAVDLRDTKRINGLIQQIGATIKSDKFWTGIIVMGLICFALWVLTRKK